MAAAGRRHGGPRCGSLSNTHPTSLVFPPPSLYSQCGAVRGAAWRRVAATLTRSNKYRLTSAVSFPSRALTERGVAGRTAAHVLGLGTHAAQARPPGPPSHTAEPPPCPCQSARLSCRLLANRLSLPVPSLRARPAPHPLSRDIVNQVRAGVGADSAIREPPTAAASGAGSGWLRDGVGEGQLGGPARCPCHSPPPALGPQLERAGQGFGQARLRLAVT